MAAKCERRDRTDNTSPENVTHKHDPRAVEPINERTAKQEEQQLGEECHREDDTQRARPAHLEHPPGECYAVNVVAQP